jgi:HEAT repeat protein
VDARLSWAGIRKRFGSAPRWLWIVLIAVLLLVSGWLLLRYQTVNEMYPALDKLASISLSERWSHPEMIKIRQLGPAAVPPLRRVLREKDKPTTRFLLWVKTKWPAVAKYYPYMPDTKKMTERRWTACQVIQTLGPAAKAAVPELIQVIESKDAGDVNAGVMALWAVGIDADACELLDESLEQGKAGFGRGMIISSLGNVKPPSTRTLNALTHALADPSPYIQQSAAETLGRLGVATPVVIKGMERLQSSSTNDLVAVNCAVALWQLQHDGRAAANAVFQILERLLQNPIAPPIGSGNGGQGVEATEQVFIKGAELFPQLHLADTEKARALGILESFCEKSGRNFIRMLLLPAMMELGLSREKCVDVCETGLRQEEYYYRLQAAQLLVGVAERFPSNEIKVDELIHDKDLGVRVYAAKIHWRNNKKAEVVLPVLTDALDRKKHQSYYYEQILSTALSVLGDIGSEAHAASSAVAALTHDPNPRIAQLATDTLNKIGE